MRFLTILFSALSLAGCGGGGGALSGDAGGRPGAGGAPAVHAVEARTTRNGVAAGLTSGGTAITVRGDNFLAPGAGLPVVSVGTSVVSATIVNDDTLEAVTPSGPEGLADVVVTNDNGRGVLPGAFDYRRPLLFAARHIANLSYLYRMDPANPGTGFTNRLGDYWVDHLVDALAMSPDGRLIAATRLYGLNNQQFLYDVDPDTGEFDASQSVALRGVLDGSDVGFVLALDLDYASNGDLMGYFRHWSDTTDRWIGRVEPQTGRVTLIESFFYGDDIRNSGRGFAELNGTPFLSPYSFIGSIPPRIHALDGTYSVQDTIFISSLGTHHTAMTALGGRLYAVDDSQVYDFGDTKLVTVDSNTGDVQVLAEPFGQKDAVALAGNFK